jgi:hypothetical protein
MPVGDQHHGPRLVLSLLWWCSASLPTNTARSSRAKGLSQEGPDIEQSKGKWPKIDGKTILGADRANH